MTDASKREGIQRDVPVLTDVVEGPAPRLQVPPELAAQLDTWLIDQLPVLVREVVTELSPKLEQQLLDALMPRVLASLSQWQGDMD
ncbi:hypothetical protein [Inhella gelatinilytica]|uniref:Uncharacterized protein n=1 Tax=Inhella gelatinilytica TaxID=2795030 RepID=A0A931NFN9_9BURK|nr:hypothetical protein [Inhella gelatinilytica]MBH9553746.1 hypothetical protein [Inhella gelatinilytica]